MKCVVFVFVVFMGIPWSSSTRHRIRFGRFRPFHHNSQFDKHHQWNSEEHLHPNLDSNTKSTRRPFRPPFDNKESTTEYRLEAVVDYNPSLADKVPLGQITLPGTSPHRITSTTNRPLFTSSEDCNTSTMRTTTGKAVQEVVEYISSFSDRFSSTHDRISENSSDKLFSKTPRPFSETTTSSSLVTKVPLTTKGKVNSFMDDSRRTSTTTIPSTRVVDNISSYTDKVSSTQKSSFGSISNKFSSTTKRAFGSVSGHLTSTTSKPLDFFPDQIIFPDQNAVHLFLGDTTEQPLGHIVGSVSPDKTTFSNGNPDNTLFLDNSTALTKPLDQVVGYISSFSDRLPSTQKPPSRTVRTTTTKGSEFGIGHLPSTTFKPSDLIPGKTTFSDENPDNTLFSDNSTALTQPLKQIESYISSFSDRFSSKQKPHSASTSDNFETTTKKAFGTISGNFKSTTTKPSDPPLGKVPLSTTKQPINLFFDTILTTPGKPLNEIVSYVSSFSDRYPSTHKPSLDRFTYTTENNFHLATGHGHFTPTANKPHDPISSKFHNTPTTLAKPLDEIISSFPNRFPRQDSFNSQDTRSTRTPFNSFSDLFTSTSRRPFGLFYDQLGPTTPFNSVINQFTTTNRYNSLSDLFTTRKPIGSSSDQFASSSRRPFDTFSDFLTTTRKPFGSFSDQFTSSSKRPFNSFSDFFTTRKPLGLFSDQFTPSSKRPFDSFNDFFTTTRKPFDSFTNQFTSSSKRPFDSFSDFFTTTRKPLVSFSDQFTSNSKRPFDSFSDFFTTTRGPFGSFPEQFNSSTSRPFSFPNLFTTTEKSSDSFADQLISSTGRPFNLFSDLFTTERRFGSFGDQFTSTTGIPFNFSYWFATTKRPVGSFGDQFTSNTERPINSFSNLFTTTKKPFGSFTDQFTSSSRLPFNSFSDLLTTTGRPLGLQPSSTFLQPFDLTPDKVTATTSRLFTFSASRNSTITPPTTTSSSETTTLSPAFTSCFNRCATTSQYDPVCGSDNQTYFNEGRLNCRSKCGLYVTKTFNGVCAPLLPGSGAVS